MSGVEAVLGVVTGGAGLLSLGMQLGDCAARLKKLYHTAKDAPQRLRRISFDLETMTAALDQIEMHRQHDNHADYILGRCIEGCQQSVMDIESLVVRLECKMSKFPRGAGKVYAAIKSDDIKELLDELERSRSSLQLAYMMYLSEEQRRRDHGHMAVLIQHQTNLRDLQSHFLANGTRMLSQTERESSAAVERDEESPKHSNVHHNGEVVSWTRARRGTNSLSSAKGTHNRSVRSKRLKIGLPSWLCSRIWDVAFIQTQHRWTMHLTTYNKIPNDAPVFEYILQNDIGSLQKFFADGRASQLDVYDSLSGTKTLLELAAQKGHYEICQLLMKCTTWPDESEVLNRALEWFAYSNGCNAKMYRLFLEPLASLISLHEGERRYVWMAKCSSPECFDIIQRELLPNFYEDQLEARFELAVRTSGRSECADFLSRIGLRREDHRLATLKDKNGRTVLHCVAACLWNLACQQYPSQELRDWVDLGVHVLQNGADPYIIAMQDPEDYARSILVSGPIWHKILHRGPCVSTPFLECIDISDWGVTSSSHLRLAMMLENLRIWIEMMDRAGYDLLEYGMKEAAMWRQLGIGDLDRTLEANTPLADLIVHGLSSSSSPDEWDLNVRWMEYRSLRRLCCMSGTISQSSNNIPDTIAWVPNAEEDTEGPWSVVRRKRRFQGPVTLAEINGQRPEPFIDLMDSVQDDCGPIMLITMRACRPRNSSKRSHSQPASLQRRWSAHCPPQTSRPWIPSYHLCPGTGRWELNCIVAEHRYIDATPDFLFPRIQNRNNVRLRYIRNPAWAFDMRACVEGRRNGLASVQEFWTWQKASFLSPAYKETSGDIRASFYCPDTDDDE